jgi:hypothetical protein
LIEQTQITRKFRIDKLSFDTDATISETAEYLTVEPVTFIREGVYPYEDGRAYKPGVELAAAAEVAGDLHIAWDHPPQKVITNHKEVKGFADGIHVEKDGKGVKIKGRMTFLKKRLNEDQIELIRSKARPDVSLGFYYSEDRTPGNWNGEAYDYVQRDFIFDHVASVNHGRCPHPMCGIGVDTSLDINRGMTRIGNDPYPNEHSCRIRQPGDFQAESFRRIKSGKVSLILARLKGEKTMTLQAVRYPTASWSVAEARSNCAGRKGSFEPANSAKGDTIMTKKEEDVPGGQKFTASMANLRPAEQPLEAPEEAYDYQDCGHCVFYNFYEKESCTIVEGSVSRNMTCDNWTGKPTLERWVQGLQRGNANETADGTLTAEQQNRIPRSEWGYTPSENRSEWKLPMPDREHVIAALQALQGARGGVDIPSSNRTAVKRKVCARAKSFDIKSEYCGTADANDRMSLLRRFLKMDLADLVKLHDRIDHADDFAEDSILHERVTLALRKARRRR